MRHIYSMHTLMGIRGGGDGDYTGGGGARICIFRRVLGTKPYLFNTRSHGFRVRIVVYTHIGWALQCDRQIDEIQCRAFELGLVQHRRIPCLQGQTRCRRIRGARHLGHS